MKAVEKEVELDFALEISSLQSQVEFYKRAYKQEQLWRWVCCFMATVMLSSSFFDIWIG